MERGLRAIAEWTGDMLVNKEAKRLLIRLMLLTLAAAAALQIAAYLNMFWIQREMMERDYAIAGYLLRLDPSLAGELPSIFKAAATGDDLEAGRQLLAEAGYHSDLPLRFMPAAHAWYKTNAAAGAAATAGLGAVLLGIVGRFLSKQYDGVERIRQEVQRSMNGAASVRLNDSEEGHLSRLASSLNVMIASLHTHIEKEKHHRSFLKQLLTEVSHQLKTPLSALAMYNEIMREERTDNNVIGSFLLKSGRELERMNGLIANLLKLARLDAGSIKLDLSDCRLNELIGQAADSFRIRLEQERKQLTVAADEEVVYPCDAAWMVEAVSNLIKNAAEHTAEGDRIEIRLEHHPLMIQIVVRDTGEGIHPGDLNLIFKPFYRSPHSRSKQGTGIGLTLARTIAEMHGGFLSADSAVGQGSTFTLRLPKTYKMVSGPSPQSKFGRLS